MPNVHPQNEHVTKERGNECGKVGTTSAKGGHGGLKLEGDGWHGSKVAT